MRTPSPSLRSTKMQEFDLAQKALRDIVKGDIYFNDALKKIFQVNVELRPLRGAVAGLVGCELRHHILFNYLIDELKLENITEEDRLVISLALANLYFFKRFSLEDTTKVLKEKLGEEKLASIQPLIEKADKPNEFIPENLEKTSNKYLSLRYNTPEWVLKIWQHFGYGLTYRVLKANNRQNIITTRVRTSKVTVDEILNNNPDFVKSPVEDVLIYGGKTPLRKLEPYAKGNLFLERMAVKAMLSEYKIEEPKEAFLYNGNLEPSLFKEMLELYQNQIGLNLGCPDTSKFPEIIRLIKDSGFKNVNFFGAAPDSMESAISRPQDLVIAAPNSSNFDLIREYPDYLMHFKKEGMDALFAQEKAVLEGASKYVAEKGLLIYTINTLSKKEGHLTVVEFLNNHKEFHLTKEVQAYPFEDMQTTLYYAVMVKDTNAAKKAAPLGDITSLNNSEPTQIAASEK